jgi:cell division protein FtsI/penicillin-binding protein 2
VINPGHLRRFLLVAALLALALAALGWRLVHVQYVQHEHYREIAGRNIQRVFFREPRRGDILDAHGNPLATSVPVKKVCANPRFVGRHHAEVARVLAPLLNWDEAGLAARLRPVTYTNAQGRLTTNAYVNLHRKVSEEQWQQITAAMASLATNLAPPRPTPTDKAFYRNLRHAAIYALDDQQRVYPCGNLAAHVVGFAQEKETEFNNTSVVEWAGKDGIEAWFNSKLSGVRGWRVTETDGRRREILVAREQDVEARPGLNVVLTLDMVVQNIVEAELAEAVKKHTPISASALVVRPRTGEILALATWPNYDPNRPGESSDDARRNRVITDLIEPGSTFKIVVVAAALNEGLVRLTDIFDCENGVFWYAGRRLRDHGHYGPLTVENIITKSSNIGAAKIGLKLGEERLYEYVRAFGFGTNTGLTLGGEVRGIVHPPARWDKLTITRLPMGHGISVTPLQMTMAMCALANEGQLMRPMIVKGLRDAGGDWVVRYQPERIRQVVSARAARDTVTALKTVVGKDGTAPKAALDHYTVAGKTGTAQKPGPGGYLEDQYLSSFIGFFPADAPEVCLAVVLDNPRHGYYGGQVAAPFFKNIAEQVAQYLKVRPDREPPPAEKVAGMTAVERVSTAALRNP